MLNEVMEKEKAAKEMQKTEFFIGVDVSKNKLDYAVIKGSEFLFHRVGGNDPGEISKFIIKLEEIQGFELKNALFCMENTGIYCNHLIQYLNGIEANIVVENPMKIKNSTGIARGKNDKIDAIRIAQYALKNNDDLKKWTPRRDVVLQLMRLSAIRNRLVTIANMLRTPLKEAHTFVSEADYTSSTHACKKSSEAIGKDIKQTQKYIDRLINSDNRLKNLKNLIMSVPGIGPITATQIIISTNEFQDINNPKKFASYAGVAPFKNESGAFARKARVSHIANKKMKTLLHISAWAAVRTNEELKTYYLRKTQEQGKSKMATLNAIRNKLILRVFACVKEKRRFVNDFLHPTFTPGADSALEIKGDLKSICDQQLLI